MRHLLATTAVLCLPAFALGAGGKAPVLAPPAALKGLVRAICQTNNAGGTTDWRVAETALPAKLPGWELVARGTTHRVRGGQQEVHAVYWQGARVLRISIDDANAPERGQKVLGGLRTLKGHSLRALLLPCQSRASAEARYAFVSINEYLQPVERDGKRATGDAVFDFNVDVLRVRLSLTLAVSDRELLGIAAHLKPELLAKIRTKPAH